MCDEESLREALCPLAAPRSSEDSPYLSRYQERTRGAGHHRGSRAACGNLPPVPSGRRSGLIVLLAALAGGGCGTHVHSAAPSKAAAAAALAGSPAPLAALHAQADQLLGGGIPSFQARMADLRGYPVVVNKWASWCGPCQSEFPVFQRVAVALGRRVAFLGVDGNDHDGAARSFLRQFPVSYPSYTDPDHAISDAIQAATYFPQTVFFDRSGKRVFAHV